VNELLKHCHEVKVKFSKHEDSVPIELQITFKATTKARVGMQKDAASLIADFLANIKEQGDE
jgi:hypothetical protein